MPEGNSSRLAAKANKLYWGTTRPAGRLADELGVSRSKFYALIEPIHLRVKCPRCNTPLVYSSRTDRESGRGHCPECGDITELSESQRATAPATPAARAPGASPSAAARDWAVAPPARPVWIAALFGAAVGLLAGAWWRRT